MNQSLRSTLEPSLSIGRQGDLRASRGFSDAEFLSRLLQGRSETP